MLLYEKLTGWLQRHDDRLERFKHPIPLSEVCAEINEPLNTLRAFLSSCERPIYHVWTYRYKGQTRSKPYCCILADQTMFVWIGKTPSSESRRLNSRSEDTSVAAKLVLPSNYHCFCTMLR